MRRHHLTLQTYIGREFLLSFIVSFLFFFFIFFVNNMLLLAEDILAKKVPIVEVIRLIVYTLPSVVSISFPFASLVGALMAVGRLSSDNELIAFQASGIPRRVLFVPFIVLGIAFTVTSFIMNDYFIPLGNINFGKLYRRVFLANPELELESYSVKRYQDTIIVIGDVSKNSISDIIILDSTEEKNDRLIAAKNASLTEHSDQSGVISLELSDVFSHTTDSAKRSDYEYFESREMIYNILLSDISISIAKPGPREMSSIDVYHEIEDKRGDQDMKIAELNQNLDSTRYELAFAMRTGGNAMRPNGVINTAAKREVDLAFNEIVNLLKREFRDLSIRTYELEFYKKFSLPAGCLVFVFFAFPVGLFTRKSGRAVGFGIGLFVTILYWGFLLAGQTFGIRLNFSPFLSMWLPNFLIIGFAIFFFALRLRR